MGVDHIPRLVVAKGSRQILTAGLEVSPAAVDPERCSSSRSEPASYHR